MRWDVIKSFALRTAVSAAFAGMAYAGDNVTDLGASPENAALFTFALSYAGHILHAFAAKHGIDPNKRA